MSSWEVLWLFGGLLSKPGSLLVASNILQLDN